ncbi:GNAT family N-acetyltransferase [Streptomyces sp. NPDC058256]|uniref:GNAT family N-acetyltransferase n=1 Tax=Streptomyces sp. NPDC058256 TaxID=3346408 RepID=UPI0036E8DD94
MTTPALYTSMIARTDTGTPEHHTHAATRTVTRPATLDDFDAVNALHERCSLDTRFARYQAARRTLRFAEFRHLTHPEYSLTWVSHPEDEPEQIIATMNLVRTSDASVAELGIMIDDRWQGRGLGTVLVQYAQGQARALGYASMTAMTGSGNVRMLKIMRTLGPPPPITTGSTVDITVSVE